MKIKAIVSMIALAAAASASQAAVVDTITQQDVFLSVYDQANKASYLYDTGLNATTIFAAGSTVNFNFNVSSDVKFASFLSTVGAGADLSWTVAAISFQNGKDTKRWWTTTTDSATPVPAANVNFNAAVNPQHTALTNTTVNGPENAGPSEVAAFGTANYFGSNFDAGNLIGTTGTFNTVGVKQSIFRIANSNTSSNVALFTVANTGVTAQFNQVGGAYNLSISAVPEPESYALALLGLAAIGVIARRRTK